MPRYSATRIFVVTTLAILPVSALMAQAPGTVSTEAYTQTQPAPIERAPHRNLSGVTTQQPAQGVFVRVGAGAAVTTVSKADDHTELRVDRGVVNVSVHHPAENSLILVDLPGGQVDLVKDGFYTFNAQTNTVHVLVGEARAFPGATGGGEKGIKVKEYQQFAFAGGARSMDMNAMQARTDVLPFPRPNGGEAPYRGGEYGGPYYGGFYPAYYGYGYGYPYGWGYPYGYGFGYPYVGVGFGYGFGGGYGFRGGYYGGFRGHR